MVPTLQPGDEVTIRRVSDIEGLRLGEIVCLRSPKDGKLVLHRLLKLGDDGTVKTAGDGKPRPDPAVVQRYVLGIMVSAKRQRNSEVLKPRHPWLAYGIMRLPHIRLRRMCWKLFDGLLWKRVNS